MKNYKTLLKEMPSKAIVIAFGRFNPPTTGHELVINKTTKFAQSKRIDYQIWVTHTVDKKKNPLPQDRKLYFLKRMFGANIKFVGTSAPDKRTLIEVAKFLNKKYDELYIVAGSDRVPEYQKLLTQYNGKDYNFKKIQVVSSGKRDPDSDSAEGMSATKMRAAATKGDFAAFKRGVPATMTIADAKRMFNEVRKGLGLAAVNEEISLQTSEIRERYVAGEIFNVGSVVEDKNGVYEVMDRGANYITVVDSEGNLSKKWLNEVVEVSKEIHFDPSDILSYKGYVTENFTDSEEVTAVYRKLIESGKDPIAVLNAIKLTDECLNIIKEASERGYATDDEANKFKVAQLKIVDTLSKIDELEEHAYIDGLSTQMQSLIEKNEDKSGSYGIRFTGADRIKVARIIAGSLGVESPEKSSNPSQLVNMGLRKIRTKRMTPEFMGILEKMLGTAKAAGIEYDEGLLPSLMKKKKEKIVEEDKSQEEITKERIKKEKEADAKKHDRELDTARLRDTRKKNAMSEATVHKVDKSSNFNMAKSIMSYSDFKKMLGIQGGLEKRNELGELDTDGADHPDVLKRREIKRKIIEEFTPHMMYSPEGDEKMVETEDEHKKLAAKGWVEDPEDIIKDEDDDDIVNKFDPEKDPLEDEDVLDLYDDEELIIVDDEDEELEESVLFPLEEAELNEVLSRAERIKSRIRMKKTAAKRKRALRISLKKHSSSQVINRRSRRLAVKLIKQRLFKKPASKMSVGEKERAEARVKKMNKVVNRIAMKLAPKVRKLEKKRLTHARTKK